MQSRETANSSKTSQNHTSAPITNPFQARTFDVDTPKEPKQVEEAAKQPEINLRHIPVYPPGTTPPARQESLLPSPVFENSSRKYEFVGNPVLSPSFQPIQRQEISELESETNIPETTPPSRQESLLPSPVFENSSRKYEFVRNPVIPSSFHPLQRQEISPTTELESETNIPEEQSEINLRHIPVYPPGTTPPPRQESLLPSPIFENQSRKYEFVKHSVVSPEPTQTVQLKGNESKSAPVNVEESINSKKGSGEGLADNIRQPMEEAFGADFGGVKIHADGESDQLNQSLSSRAFATGQDIFFKQGAYNPSSRDGQELLAHELTHVVQQNSGVQRQFSDSQDNNLLIPKRELAQGNIQRQKHNTTQIININTSGPAQVKLRIFRIPTTGNIDADRLMIVSLMWIFVLNEKQATKVKDKYSFSWEHYEKPTEQELQNKVRVVSIPESTYEEIKTDLYGTNHQNNNSQASSSEVNGSASDSIHSPRLTNPSMVNGSVSGSSSNNNSSKYGTANQNTDNSLTPDGRRKTFDGLVSKSNGIFQQRILTATASQIYNKTHPENPVSLDTTPGNNQEWDLILDHLLQQRDLLNGLPNGIKQVLGGQDLFEGFPQDYPQLLRIARNLNELSPQLLRGVKPLNFNNIYNPGELDIYEQYVSNLSKSSGISSVLPAENPETTTGQTEKEQLSRLPENIKFLLGEEKYFQPKNYQQLLQIAKKLQQFASEDFAVYKLLTIRATDDLDLFAKSVDMYLARKEELKKALAQEQERNPKQPTMQDAMNEKWQGLDESAVSKMSEDERYQLAYQKTGEMTAVQLKFMREHPGQTLTDFAKSATLINSGETFSATAKEIIEAASGDANAWARWAAGAGAGAKISGWLLAVGGIVYVASWFTGVGELGTIATAAVILLGSSMILSVAESELRIKAASQAKEPEEFKRNVELASAARTNVIMAVSMIVTGAVLHFTAKAFFPRTVENINTSLKRFQGQIRFKASLSRLKPEIVTEMSLRKRELVQVTELAKQKALAAAKDLEGLNTEQFVERLENGDNGFLNKSKVSPEQKLNYRELLKTPEGRAAIESYKQELVNALKTDVIKGIDDLAHEYSAKIDEFLQEIDAVKNTDELNAAIDKRKSALTEEHMKKFMQEEQENRINLKAPQDPASSQIAEKAPVSEKNNLVNDIDLTTKRTDLTEIELETYMKSVNNEWELLLRKVYYENKNTSLMSQLIKYRGQKYRKLVNEIQEEFEVNHKGDMNFKDVAPGSTQPTSDYDATFISKTGDKNAEVRAVIEFNRRFRIMFGKESGTTFDTNVYTTGHMLKSSLGNTLDEVLALRKLDYYLTELPDKLAQAKKLLDTLQGNARDEMTEKISKMEEEMNNREPLIKKAVGTINKLREANPNQGSKKIEYDNIDVEEISTQVREKSEQLVNEVTEEKNHNQVTPSTQKQLSANQDVMALLKQRRNMSAEEWSQDQETTVAKITDEKVKDVTKASFDKADQIYHKATQELNERIVEENRNKAPEEQIRNSEQQPETDSSKIIKANKDAEIEASNRLFEHYLKKTQLLRDELERYLKIRSEKKQSNIETKQEDQKIDALTLQVDEMQSKALFFANEAYHTRAAAEHIVLGQQLKLEIPLDIYEYLTSINEQIGFAMEQSGTSKSFGKALWKTAKYMDRVNDAILKIEKKSPGLFDQTAKEKISRMKDLFDELITIKKDEGKYYGMTDQQKSTEAIRVLRDKGFGYIEDIEGLRLELRNFNVEINSQIRNARPNEYNTKPSELDNWPNYTPHQHEHSNSFRNMGNNITQSPVKTIELTEFG